MRLFAPVLADFWHYRELLWQFTLRNVELRHKGSRLGFVWPFLNPLLMLGLYVFVFGFIFGGRFGIVPNETPVDYALGILIGLAFFQLLAEVIGISPLVIVTQSNFVKKVVLPLEILPVASVGVSIFYFLIYLVFVAIGVTLLGPGLSLGMLWMPVIIFPMVLLALGLAWLISSLGVFYRDIGQLAQFLSQVLMFASAVFYSSKNIPPSAWNYLRFNPLLLSIELSRDALLWHKPINLLSLGYLYALGLFACYLGYSFFRRLKPVFADIL